MDSLPRPYVLLASNFEVDGQPSIESWTDYDANYPSPIFFSNDVDTLSGQWSIGLKARDSLSQSTSLLYTIPVNGKISTGTLQLSCSAKFPFPNTRGSIVVSASLSNGGFFLFSTQLNSPTWENKTMDPRPIGAPIIQIRVVISAVQSGFVDTSQFALFDNIRLIAN